MVIFTWCILPPALAPHTRQHWDTSRPRPAATSAYLQQLHVDTIDYHMSIRCPLA